MSHGRFEDGTHGAANVSGSGCQWTNKNSQAIAGSTRPPADKAAGIFGCLHHTVICGLHLLAQPARSWTPSSSVQLGLRMRLASHEQVCNGICYRLPLEYARLGFGDLEALVLT